MAREKASSEDNNNTADASEAGDDTANRTASVDNSSPEPPCLVVGIGASAGGQAALEQLFTSMPTDCGLSFVVIMHLHPEGPSYLHEILGRYTSMPVLMAEDEMPLQPNTVHVIPPGVDLTVAEGRVRFETAEKTRGAHHPIDRFFQSLAVDAAERGVAVLLSGFGIDGSAGAKAVREAGGAVLVQEPATALNPAMPKSAIATGAVDFVLPAEEIAAKIADIARGNCVLPHHSCRVASLDDELGAIFRIVKLKTGHDFSSYKQNTVMRRIERRMAMNEANGIGKYVALIEEDPREAQALCQDILIGVTSFFRDPEAFEVLRHEVIPRLFEGRDHEEPVRIWHACCATGEEVYSMAILIQEYLSKHGQIAKVQLFASDIDEPAISQARAGIYPADIAQDLGQERLERFFTRTDGRWQVKKQIREMVVFAHHSLIKDPPFSRLDLLVCRNFLIYLNPDMQKRLIALFHQVLKSGGVLFLGNAETVGRNSDLFATIDNKWKIFERLESTRRTETVFPLSTSVRMPTVHRPSRPAEPPEPSPGIIAERLLMERYSPPCVVVSYKFEMVHVSTRLSRFLEVPTGEPSRDILRMAREELRPTLRAAIYKALAEQKRIEFRGVKVVDEGGETTVNLIVEPLGPTPGSRLALVIFEPSTPPATMTASSGEEGVHGGETSREMLIRQLEEQLRVTHEQLQATSEQLETSNEGFMSANEELMSINEEFQSANEELQSTNEELETSKEELQALNEELITVNSELQGKVEELNLATSDMENLLASSGIATLFLDRTLNIKGFTPAVAAIFNLISADIGRPFRHLAGKIDWPTLTQDADTVLSGQPFTEREVTSLDREHCYLKRILPYRTQEGSIDGLVVTFIDITERKLIEEQTVHLASFPRLNPNPVLEVDATGMVTFFNPATQSILESLGLDTTKVELFLPADLDGILREWDRKYEATLYREITVSAKTFGESIFLTPQFDCARIYAFDITERKRTEEALAESEQRVRRKLESIITPEGDIGDMDLADIIDAQPMQLLMDNFYKLTGMPMGMIDLKGKVLVGVGWQDICTKFHRIHPETRKNCIESDTLLTAGVPQGEYKLYKCKNNMWDVATPIMVGGRQFGNFFMGQFFFDDEPVDYAFFRSQAKQYGYDEKEYIASLEKVPRLSREALATGMAYFMELAGMISRMSYSNIKLARSLAERDTLMESLRESEERFRSMFERHRAVMLLVEPESGAIVDANAAAAEFYGSSREELCRLKIQDINQLPSGEVAALLQDVLRGQQNQFKAPHRLANDEIRWVEVYSTSVEAQGKTLLFSIIHDITERERAEEALRESRERLELALASSRMATFDWDIVRNKRTWSDGVHGLLGTNRETFTGTAEEFFQAMHPEDRSTVQASLERAVETGVYEAEYRAVWPDGSMRHISARGKVHSDDTGQAVLLAGVCWDATEAKLAEERLRTQARTLKALNSSNHALLHAHDEMSLLQAVCRTVAEDCGHAMVWIGYAEEDEEKSVRPVASAGFEEGYLETLRISWADTKKGRGPTGTAIRTGKPCGCGDMLSDPAFEPWRDEALKRGYASSLVLPLMGDGRAFGAISIYSAKPNAFSEEETALLMQLADELAYGIRTVQLRVAHDQAEEALIAYYRRQNLLADTAGRLLAADSPQQVVDELCQNVLAFLDCHAFFNFLVDEKEQRLHLNACAGIPEEEKQKIEWLDYGVAVCGCAARDACRIVAEDIPNTPDPRTELVNSFGIQAYACHPLIAQERVLGTLSFGTRSKTSFSDDDISLMKAVADQVAIAMERKRVEEELRRALETAEAATRAKSQFLANMSHELRNPMTGVLGMLDLVLGGPLGEQQSEYLCIARNSARSLLRILNDILDLTKVESGKLVIKEEPFALKEWLASTADIFVPEARRKGIELLLSTAEALPHTVVGDRIRLRQVLTNLVGNAVKFTEQGRVEVRVEAGCTIPDGRREFTFTISDTGIGIPEDKRHILFNSFSQIDESNTRSYGGTGLGLAISREIVKLMGGTISFEGKEDAGSVFFFTIPLGEAAAERETLAMPEEAPPVACIVPPGNEGEKMKRLLVVEDDPTNRTILGQVLKLQKFEIDFAENGLKAVEMWENNPYDLIVMDVQMPVMDGFEATRTIREKELATGGRITIVALTAHAFREDEQRCLDAGMDAYLAKPIDLAKSVALIRELLSK